LKATPIHSFIRAFAKVNNFATFKKEEEEEAKDPYMRPM
jgi:hypothetical protein